MLLRMAVMSPFMAIGAITMAIAKHPTISTILVFSIIMVVGTLALLWKVAMPKFRIIQRLVDHMNLVVRENLSGLRVVRAFNTQKVQIEKTQKVAYDSMQKNIFVNRIFSAMW